MRPRWECGKAVRVIRSIRNDGTYPGMDTGPPLVQRGSVGHIVDVGSFLQDQIIYSIHFLDPGRIVGCREEELIGMDEDWVPSRYEFREKVKAAAALRHSQCPTALQGGQLGLVKGGQLYPELEDAAFALAENEISAILESPVGLHLVRCEQVFEAGKMDFALVKERIAEKLTDQRRRRAQRDWIAAL